MLWPFSTPFTFCGSIRRRMRRLQTTRCYYTWVLAVFTCQPSTTRRVICPSWNFSIGRALANLSVGYYRFAAYLKKITHGRSRCTRCLKGISCLSLTTSCTSSLPLKSRLPICNLPPTIKILRSIGINQVVATVQRAFAKVKIKVFQFW
jgi:hypothetical protein